MNAPFAEARAALLADYRKGAGGADILRRLDAAVTEPLDRSAENAELLLAHAQLAWIADQRNPNASRARQSAERLIEMVPDLADGYRLFGFACLTRREYRDAFLALSAVKTIPTPMTLDNFRALARFLMSGVPKVSFPLAGETYAFDLTTHNAAAIESSAFHSVGLLTEWEELQYLATLLDPAKVKRIAEVGVLLGNHTAFFLKTLKPSHITLIDADPANTAFIARTVAYNRASPHPEVRQETAFVGAATGEITFAGTKVPVRPLTALVEGPVDFLKIDVDGGEETLLQGAAPVIENTKPIVMIETTPRTHTPVEQWFTARGYTTRKVFDHGDYRNVVLMP